MVNRKAVLIALLVSFVAAWIAYSVLKGGLPFMSKTIKAEGVEVLVAANDIPERQPLNDLLFVRQTVPKDMFHDQMVTQLDPATPAYAKGAIVRGEILYRNKLAKIQDEPELSYMIDWNQGCISIRATDITGVSGIIKPGDYVDVYGSYEVTKGSDKKVITLKIAAAMRVVATEVEVLPPAGGNAKQFGRARGMGPITRVTLAGTTTQLRKLAHASGQSTSPLHLALINDAVGRGEAISGVDPSDIERQRTDVDDSIDCYRGAKWERVYVLD